MPRPLPPELLRAIVLLSTTSLPPTEERAALLRLAHTGQALRAVAVEELLRSLWVDGRRAVKLYEAVLDEEGKEGREGMVKRVTVLLGRGGRGGVASLVEVVGLFERCSVEELTIEADVEGRRAELGVDDLEQAVWTHLRTLRLFSTHLTFHTPPAFPALTTLTLAAAQLRLQDPNSDAAALLPLGPDSLSKLRTLVLRSPPDGPTAGAGNALPALDEQAIARLELVAWDVALALSSAQLGAASSELGATLRTAREAVVPLLALIPAAMRAAGEVEEALERAAVEAEGAAEHLRVESTEAGAALGAVRGLRTVTVAPSVEVGRLRELLGEEVEVLREREGDEVGSALRRWLVESAETSP
ncbi:hypothetical protein JCM10207_005693 [Rhodosporidiobolus poonsookiae]